MNTVRETKRNDNKHYGRHTGLSTAASTSIRQRNVLVKMRQLRINYEDSKSRRERETKKKKPTEYARACKLPETLREKKNMTCLTNASMLRTKNKHVYMDTYVVLAVSGNGVVFDVFSCEKMTRFFKRDLRSIPSQILE